MCSDFGIKDLLEEKDPKQVFIQSFKFVADGKKEINFEKFKNSFYFMFKLNEPVKINDENQSTLQRNNSVNDS